jgi:hypothetical protein
MDSRLMKATTIKAAKDTADGVARLLERLDAIEAKLDALAGSIGPPRVQAEPPPQVDRGHEGRRR